MKLNGPAQQPGESREAYLNRMFAPLTGAEMERMVRDEAERWYDDALQEAAKIVDAFFPISSERCVDEIFALRTPEALFNAAVTKGVQQANAKQPATEEQGIGELLEANRTLSAEVNRLRALVGMMEEAFVPDNAPLRQAARESRLFMPSKPQPDPTNVELRRDLEHWREEHRAMARRCGGLSKSNSNLTIKLAELQGVLREVRRDNFLPKPLQQAVDAALSWDPPAPKPDPTNDVVGHATPIDAVLDANKSLADDNALQRERIVELLALVRRMAAFVPNAPSPLRTAVDKALLNAPVSTLTEALRSWLENLERRVCVIERQVKERVG